MHIAHAHVHTHLYMHSMYMLSMQACTHLRHEAGDDAVQLRADVRAVGAAGSRRAAAQPHEVVDL